MPMIAISGEADDENFSLSDSEEANKAKSLIASRMRRRQKKKRDAGESKTSAALIVDDGDESGMTDVETVECDGDDANTDSSVSNAADELAPVFEIRPHIVHIVEDEEGRMRVNTIVQGVIAVEDGQESEEDGQDGAKFVDVATDVESFEDTSSDEGESVSESSELRNTIGNMDIGGDVNTRNIEEEGKVVALPSFGASLQLPTGGKKKVRKHRSKKKAAATATSGGLLAVGSRDDEQLTDVESISGIEELECDSPSQTPSRPAAFLTVTPAADEGATDVESLSGVDDESASVSIHLAPGILVTGDDDGSSCSGRSSRLGLTDVEELAGDESPLLGLSVPQASADPLTDVEDIDGVDEEEGVSRRVPRNGPAAHRGQSHVVDISVDEDGRITSRKSARSPALLSVGLGQDDGGVTETESVGVSGDESEDVSTEHPAPEINLESTTVEHKSDPAEQEDPDAAGNETSGGTGYTLMPPTTAAEILTDTEEMEVSDSEGPASTGQMYS